MILKTMRRNSKRRCRFFDFFFELSSSFLKFDKIHNELTYFDPTEDGSEDRTTIEQPSNESDKPRNAFE